LLGCHSTLKIQAGLRKQLMVSAKLLI
jgi:hypothetical protein